MSRGNERSHWSKARRQSKVEKSPPSQLPLRFGFRAHACWGTLSSCSLCCGIVVALGKNTLTYLMVMVKQFQLSWMSLLLRKQRRRQLYRALRMVGRSGSAPLRRNTGSFISRRRMRARVGSAVGAVAQWSVYLQFLVAFATAVTFNSKPLTITIR